MRSIGVSNMSAAKLGQLLGAPDLAVPPAVLQARTRTPSLSLTLSLSLSLTLPNPNRAC